MRNARMIAAMTAATSLLLTACGGPETATTPAAGEAAGMAGDDTLIAAAEQLNAALGFCDRADSGDVEASRVIGLESGTIVMVPCSQAGYAQTYRLFAVTGGGAPRLLSLPDYKMEGWFAATQAGMAELDAGTGVLTTMRRGAGDGNCGSEGRYQWDGAQFVLQELRWQGCGDPSLKGPPFPVIWPAQQNAVAPPDAARPAP